EDVAVFFGGFEASARGEHVAEILRHALVDPEEVALLRGGGVRLVEACGAAILAVPGVGELVREEVGFGELVLRIAEGVFGDAIVGGLAMLEAFAAGGVREGEKEVIGVVVMGCVGGVGFADEVGDFGEEFGAQRGVLGLIGGDVEEVFGRDVRGKRVLVEVLAREDRGVLKLFDGGGRVACHGGAGCGRVGGLIYAGGWRRREICGLGR